MPTYTATAPSGKTLKITGDRPPTEEELKHIFAQAGDVKPDFRSGVAGDTSMLEKLASMLPSTDTMVNAIPSVTGGVGGVVGGIGGTVGGFGVGGVPGAVGGAVVGGAAGEALKQLVNLMRGRGAPESGFAAAGDIAKEGATQGAVELAGAGLGAGAKVAGKALMENAVRPTMSMVREFPNVVDTLVSERLPVGRFLPGWKKGSEQAIEKLGAASRSVKALLAKATNNGTTFANDDVAAPILGLIDDIAKQPIGNAQEKQLASMLDEFLQRHPGPLAPIEVKELKQRAQAIAKPIYKAMEKGMPVTADQTLAARFNDTIASGAKTSLETIPGVGAAEKKTQEMIGAARALKQAENRRLSLMAEGAGVAIGSSLGATVGEMLGPDSGIDGNLKKAVVGWAITRGLMSPRAMSRGALVLTHEAALQILRQFPRLAESLTTSETTSAAPVAPTVRQ